MAVYLVKTKDKDEVRLVKAKNHSQARDFVINDTLIIEALSTDRLAEIMNQTGAKIEEAPARPSKEDESNG